MIYLAVGIVVAVLGALLCLAHKAADKLAAWLRHPGGHCIPRPHPAVVLALDLRDWALSGAALLPPAPCAPPAAPRRPVNGRYLGTMPRLATRDRAPFTAVDMPVCDEPEPGPAWGDPGDGLGPQVPIARPFAPQPTWGEAPQLVVEPELAKVMMP